MKVLILSNSLESSGWSKQAEMHILALDAAGVDVYPINIDVLRNRNNDIHSRVAELHRKACKNPDIIIYNVLPSQLEKTGRAKNVSYFVAETSHFRNTNWASRLNLMDICLVPCYHNQLAAKASGVKTPVKVVPECVDPAVYSREYEQHPISGIHAGKFKFLTVGEWTTRKNIDAIIKAFWLEFSPNEPVELVVKTTPVGMSNPQADINTRLDKIKNGLKLYTTDRYKKLNILCGFASQSELFSLYKACNAFVYASRGEAFGIPVMDALGFGLSVISPNHSGLDYLNEKNSFLVSSREAGCYGAVDTLPDLYRGDEKWFEPDVISLREAMRACYEKVSLRTQKKQNGLKVVQEYSTDKVGPIYRETLEKIL